jgi:hypothetical protein
MKFKEYVVLAVLITLLGTYLFLRTSDRSQYELPLIPAMTGEEISRMEITSSGNTVELTRSGDQWQIGEKQYPADGTKVKNILNALETLKLTALVSEAKAFARYDLTDEKKISVKAWVGDRLVREIDIGKEADTYQHTFVRLSNKPNVYHAQNNFRRTFDQTTETLRDMTALSFNTLDIKEIRIASGNNNLTLSLKKQPDEKLKPEVKTAGEATDQPSPLESSPVWLTPDGNPAQADTVQRLLSQLAHLTCTGYLNDKQTKDFEHPVRTIMLKGDQTYSLSIFEKQASETSYPAISSQNSYPFTLGDSTWTRLTESLDSLFGTKKAH